VFVVIRGGGGLGPLAGKLSAYGLGNPQNARIERLTGARSVIVRGPKSLSFVFLRHSGAPSLGSNGKEATGTREGGSRKIGQS
jgi:hypothetical protein